MLEKLTEQEFNAFSKTHKNSLFFQSSYWGKLKSGTGWKYDLVGLKKDGKVKASSLLLSKKIPIFNQYIFYSPRGFLLDYNDKDLIKQYTEEIKKYVKKEKGIFFKINPLIIYQERDKNGCVVEKGVHNTRLVEYLKELGYQHTGFTTTYGQDLEPRWISVLDIKNKTEDEILKNMRSTARWGIQNSYKHGLELIELDKDKIEKFKELMQHTGQRRGFIDRPLSYYQKMYEEFSKDDKIKIMIVELNTLKYIENLNIQYNETMKKIESVKKEGLRKELESQLESIQKKIKEIEKIKSQKGEKITVAGGLFMTFGTQVVSLFGASYREYMKFNGQYFLNFEMIKYAIKNGYEKYNFYGITGEFNKESPMYGLFDFKRSFGAEVEELVGEFTYITNHFYNNIYNIMFKTYRAIKRMRK